jgi:hypothetical protein
MKSSQKKFQWNITNEKAQLTATIPITIVKTHQHDYGLQGF